MIFRKKAPRRAARRAAALCLALAAALLAGCGGAGAPPASTPAPGGVPAAQPSAAGGGEFLLPYQREEGFNPYLSQSSLTLHNSRLVFDSLVVLDDDLTPKMRVASGVVSAGGRVTIRVGQACFADGSRVTAADVAASLAAARESAVFGGRFANVAAIEAGEGLVTVTLHQPDSLFGWLLDIPVLKAGETGLARPTPSGRYSVAQDERGEYLALNSGWADSGMLKEIRLVELSGYDALVAALNIGAISLFSSEEEAELAGSIICNTAYFNLNNLVFLGMQAMGPDAPLAQPALRQAIGLAVSRRQIADKAYYCRAYVATGAVNPRFLGQAQAAVLAEEADQAAACALIESLGYTRNEQTGFYEDEEGQPLAFTLLCCTQGSFKRYAAGLIAAQLAECGIQVTVTEQPDFALYQQQILAGNAPLYIGEIKLYNNMDMSPFFAEDGAARTGLALSEELLAAYEAFKADAGGLAAFEEAFAAQMPFVPLVYRNGAAAYSKNFTGLAPTASDLFYSFEQLQPVQGAN